jgi:hypothetical protein
VTKLHFCFVLVPDGIQVVPHRAVEHRIMTCVRTACAVVLFPTRQLREFCWYTRIVQFVLHPIACQQLGVQLEEQGGPSFSRGFFTFELCV